MKKYTIFLLIIASYIISVDVPTQELFLQGNQCFYNGEFEKAITCYDKISEKSSAVWHNLGNCYYNCNDYIKALVCWKRAYKGSSYGNLQKIRDSEKKVYGIYGITDKSKLYIFIQNICYVVSQNLVYFLLLILLFYFLYCFYECVRKNNLRKNVLCKKYRFILTFLGIVVLILFIHLQNKTLQEESVIVSCEKSFLYAGPNKTFHTITIVSKGSVLHVLKKHENMTYVTDGVTKGWIFVDDIEIV